MEPSEADDQAVMAQAMGFSSFGQQARPQKKRKYNPRADAISGGNGIQKAVTGANSEVLGVRPSTAPPGINADEVDIGEDDGGEQPQATEEVQTATFVVQPGDQGDAQGRPASLPRRPAQAHGHQTDGDQRRPWYEGYCDPVSNENPWERLEKARGLESKGTWIARA